MRLHLREQVALEFGFKPLLEDALVIALGGLLQMGLLVEEQLDGVRERQRWTGTVTELFFGKECLGGVPGRGERNGGGTFLS